VFLSDVISNGWQFMKEKGIAFCKGLKWPGLTPSALKIRELAARIPVQLSALSYKSSRDFLWVVFIGGTGTGKSTLFNALIGEALSETGVERPKTSGPLAYAHKNTPIEKDFPFAAAGIQRVTIDRVPPSGYSGAPGQLLILDHNRKEFSHLVIVDTPDLDSLELKNRQMVDDLQLLADLVIFVASQEKYADEVPFRFLSRIHLGEKPYFLLLNKAEDELKADDVLEALQGQGLKVNSDRLWVLPHMPRNASASLSGAAAFTRFRETLFQSLERAQAPVVIRQERKRAGEVARSEIRLLLGFLREEEEAASKWLEQLELFCEVASRELLAAQEERYLKESRTHIQREIRKHFSKYDLLGTPRRFLSQVIRMPFRALGLWPEEKSQASGGDLDEIFRKADLRMIQAAVEGFNRSVLEKLSPQDETSALYNRLRDSNLVLTGDEIHRQMKEEQDRLMSWLEETFQRLAQGIPKSKELGIYSTSILWGALIIALETAIGGGISLLEAVLDTAVAPFVTKGAVDLFAYHELQKIVRDLGEHYQEAVTVSLRLQKKRYLEALRSLAVSPQMLQELTAVMKGIEA
jgi:hypothetical protein